MPLPAGRRQRPRPGDHLAAARRRPRALPSVGPHRPGRRRRDQLAGADRRVQWLPGTVHRREPRAHPGHGGTPADARPDQGHGRDSRVHPGPGVRRAGPPAGGPHLHVVRRRLHPEARGHCRGDHRRERRRLRGRPGRAGVHRADPDRHGREARRRHPGHRRHRRGHDSGGGRPAQGAQLRARQPDIALRWRARGLQERRERPDHDDGWRPRRADPVRWLLGQPADRCGCERRRGRDVRPGGR